MLISFMNPRTLKGLICVSLSQNAGSRNGPGLWKLTGQEVTTEIVNEHHGHRGDVQSHVHSSKLLEGHDKMNINGHPEHFWADLLLKNAG
jgi:hypothetical protein